MRRRSKTLSRQLLIQVMSYTLLLSMPVGVVNVWITYRQEAARQQEQVEAVRSLFGLQLAKAVWDFDQASAQQILSHLDQFPALQHVEVVSSDFRASYIKKGLKPAPSAEVLRYPLMAPDDDMEIGQLQLSLDAAALLPRAAAEGVVYVPGASFYAGAAVAHTMRLSFATASPREIQRGVALLGRLLSNAAVS